MRKLTTRFLALFLAFGVGLSLYFVWRDLLTDQRPARRHAEIVGVLAPARESLPLLEGGVSDPVPSSRYMIFAPRHQAPGPDVNGPVTKPTPGLDHISHSCSLLAVSIDGSRQLKLNSEDIGSLADLGSLRVSLEQVFRERVTHLAFKPGMEGREDFPVSERIEKTVIIQPSRSLTFGEVIGLMSELEKTGAKPIGLQVCDLKN